MSNIKPIFVTGDGELDKILSGLEPKMQRKFVRGALRKSTKRITKEYQRLVADEAYDTGALAKSARAKALKRSRKRVGVAMFIDREKLFARYAAKHGKPPHPAKGSSDPFYYPAVVEFGDKTHEAVRPMRRALYDNAAVYHEYFLADLRQFVNEQKVTVALPKSGGYTGKKFKK